LNFTGSAEYFSFLGSSLIPAILGGFLACAIIRGGSRTVPSFHFAAVVETDRRVPVAISGSILKQPSKGETVMNITVEWFDIFAKCGLTSKTYFSLCLWRVLANSYRRPD
jgi:hypothetical protein